MANSTISKHDSGDNRIKRQMNTAHQVRTSEWSSSLVKTQELMQKDGGMRNECGVNNDGVSE